MTFLDTYEQIMKNGYKKIVETVCYSPGGITKQRLFLGDVTESFLLKGNHAGS